MSEVVVKSGSRLYAQEIESGGLRWSADEPLEEGGQGTGPSPYRLLLSALGACTSMTVQMYAARKEWPLAGVEVKLAHRRVHAKDCSDCESKEGFIAEIDLSLKLSGDLTREQRDRLFEIAGKCPVKRTLEGEIRVRSVLTD